MVVVAASMSLAAAAAPVERGDVPPAADPYELAARWTMGALAPSPVLPARTPAPAATAPAPRFSPLPHGLGSADGTADHGVPDPGAYALMGAALLVAGLAARRLRPPRRGARKGQPAF